MPTGPGCVDAIAVLTLCRLGRTPATPEDRAVEVRTWMRLLRDLDDDQLLAAAECYGMQPGVEFWPRPGELLRLAPERSERTQVTAAMVLTPDDVENMAAIGVVLTDENWQWLRENGITFAVGAVQ